MPKTSKPEVWTTAAPFPSPFKPQKKKYPRLQCKVVHKSTKPLSFVSPLKHYGLIMLKESSGNEIELWRYVFTPVTFRVDLTRSRGDRQTREFNYETMQRYSTMVRKHYDKLAKPQPRKTDARTKPNPAA
jgi:hypothetical protein